MGVTGLWRLIEPAGKPVPVETLENKVLAVDISIWLHQMVKGYQDAKGAPLPNAHLIGLFQRLCKLLYFRIKPVFIFDGRFPDLKKETIAKRQGQKAKYNSESERLKRELALILNKKTAISTLLGKKVSPTKQGSSTMNNDEDLFKLPELPPREEETDSESDDEETSSGSIIDLHSVDLESENFKSLPVKDKYDLLVELKETRKMNSWGKLHELPKKSDNFSDFQMQRLLKRRKLQECLSETEKEMGGNCMSLNELETLLNEEGIDTKFENLPSRRIASDNNTRFLLINNVREALEEARRKKQSECNSGPSYTENNIDKDLKGKHEEKPVINEMEDDLQKAIKMSLESDCESDTSNVDDNINENFEDKFRRKPANELEDDLQKAIKMSLECVDEPQTSVCSSNIAESKTDDSWTSVVSDSGDFRSDSEEDDGFQPPDLTTAKGYIMQYSDLTYNVIDKLVGHSKTKKTNKSTHSKVDQIITELNQDKSIILDNIVISSNDESISDSENRKQNSSVSLDSSINIINSLDSTKDSVICVESPQTNVVTVDTTIEESEISINNKNSSIEVAPESDSTSEDDDFEEVVESMQYAKKPVVQLTLQINDIAEEDDIFADVFSKEVNRAHSSFTSSNEIVNSDVIPKNQDANNLEAVNHKDLKFDNKTETMQVSQEIISNVNESDVGQINEQDRELKITREIESEVVIKEKPTQMISTETLATIAKEIEDKETDLLQEKGRVDRVGRNITEQMTKEAQELLQIFGIPYIVAPTEAEAQCALLENIKLTEGTITDDSDIWLFGGRTVYKNFFNQKKHVMQFLAERIEKSYNLTREQLVLLALLVGSDYTIGINGIGPVTALEILASFPIKKSKPDGATEHHYAQTVAGLKEFKQWVRTGKRTDNTSLRKKLKNIEITEDFPSIRVVQAYLEPIVEKSEEKFSWGKFDITVLRDYTKSKFGWSQNKLDEIIKPVLKRMVDRNNQKTVHDYFNRKVDFQSLQDHMSKRVKAAVQKMGPETIEEQHTKQPNDRKRRAGNKKCSMVKQKKNKNTSHSAVAVVSTTNSDGGAAIEINIPKTDRVQEIIPQRENDKHSILQNKLKAIEIYRKTKIDRKKKSMKRKPIQPKDKAELSESSDTD